MYFVYFAISVVLWEILKYFLKRIVTWVLKPFWDDLNG